MAKSNEQVKPVRKYQKIDKEQRKLVLQLLMNEKLSLQEVANKLQLKYCTVRTIQKAYEKEGRIGKKETRKRKLRVENILKISIVNPLTLALSPPIVSSEVSQIYIDKQPTAQDQVALSQEQKQLLNQQCHQLFLTLSQECQKSLEVPNPYYQTIIKNLHMATSVIFKQLLETRPQQVVVKQEYDPNTPTMNYQFNPYQQQYASFYQRMRT